MPSVSARRSRKIGSTGLPFGLEEAGCCTAARLEKGAALGKPAAGAMAAAALAARHDRA
ncbi:MAG TPA: hypothetical protein VFK50_07710 [Sphingomicrobium sp.]|nr:hypothetical protein [Sphingomicrobium sp.]